MWLSWSTWGENSKDFRIEDIDRKAQFRSPPVITSLKGTGSARIRVDMIGMRATEERPRVACESLPIRNHIIGRSKYSHDFEIGG